MSNMKVHVLRFGPGADPRNELEAFVSHHNIEAGIVLSAVGSLKPALLRFSDKSQPDTLAGPFEIVSFSGTLSKSGGSHLHMSVSDATGRTIGGHVTEGSRVYTTLEIAIGALTDVKFTREVDPTTTYKELKINPEKRLAGDSE